MGGSDNLRKYRVTTEMWGDVVGTQFQYHVFKVRQGESMFRHICQFMVEVQGVWKAIEKDPGTEGLFERLEEAIRQAQENPGSDPKLEG